MHLGEDALNYLENIALEKQINPFISSLSAFKRMIGNNDYNQKNNSFVCEKQKLDNYLNQSSLPWIPKCDLITILTKTGNDESCWTIISRNQIWENVTL